MRKILRSQKANQDSDDEDYDNTSSGLPTRLAKGNFEIFRLVDLNSAGREEGNLIRCVDFHPQHNLAIVAGNSNTVGIYTVNTVNYTV